MIDDREGFNHLLAAPGDKRAEGFRPRPFLHSRSNSSSAVAARLGLTSRIPARLILGLAGLVALLLLLARGLSLRIVLLLLWITLLVGHGRSPLGSALIAHGDENGPRRGAFPGPSCLNSGLAFEFSRGFR
jgi:hypothetical protein